MSDTEVTAAAPASPAPPAEKSPGQQLLERMLAQTARLNRIRLRLAQVQGSIATPNLTHRGSDEATGPGVKATSFFAGLQLLADTNDKMLDELEEGVEDLGKLF